ncbi:ATP-dependent DNA helicase RecG [Mesorhizobium sp. B2-5-3]|nr:ATP-dependent DNA helicase RecG [Mesorhizobium sp. B2-5-3]
MAVEVIDISQEQAKLILDRTEGQFCDMKAIGISPGKLTKTLSAFANADGGEVFVGVDDLGSSGFSWGGFANEESANAHLQTIEECFPIGAVSRCAFLKCDDLPGLLLQVEIDKTPDIRKSSDGSVYLRRGAQNLRQDTEEKIERLRLNKGISSFEDRTISTDLSGITNSAAIIEFMLETVPAAEPETWLRKQKLIVQDKPVVAGVLLFDDEPQTDLPKASIKIYRYKTTDESGTRATLAFDPISIEGNIYRQIYEAVAQIKRITEEIPLLGLEGLEKIEYPTEAIHEVVTNSAIHRDYSINDDVHVRIFDNRIEVQSPGTLPAHVTVKNILDERAARNPKVVRLLNKFRNPPNKGVGEGLNTAFEAMRNLKLKDPVIEQKENGVLVTLRHEKLGTPEQIIVDYLRGNDEINNAVARSICFIGSENTVKRIFQKMIGAGLIERVLGRPLNKTGYVKGPNFPSQ